MKIIEEYTFFNPVTNQDQTQKKIVTLNSVGDRIDEEDYHGSTAEGWIDIQGYGGQKPTTLLYVKMQLDSVKKESLKLSSVQSWMDYMISSVAINPEMVRDDWPNAPYSFQEAIKEAIETLQSN